jgi:uncharacterized membrane protein YbhN (UPF0104 family)
VKNALILVAKLAVSAALVWYAFRNVALEGAIGLLRDLPATAAGAMLAILVVQQGVASLRTKRLLALLGERLGFRAALDSIFVGLFFSQTSVSFVGGDAMRILRMSTYGITISRGARAVLLDRVSGFVCLVGLIVVGLPFLFELVYDDAMRAGLAAAVALGLAGTALFLAMSRLPAGLRRWRIVRLVMDVATQAFVIASQPVELLWLVGISLAVHLTNVLAMYAAARGLGVEVGFVHYVVLVPPVLLLSMLPISLAGWGVREGAMIVALALVGVSPEESVAMSVCFGLSQLVIGLPGGALWLTRRHLSR